MSYNFEKRISSLAKKKWEAAGRPCGEDLAHWLAAEQEVLTSLALFRNNPLISEFAGVQKLVPCFFDWIEKHVRFLHALIFTYSLVGITAFLSYVAGAARIDLSFDGPNDFHRESSCGYMVELNHGLWYFFSFGALLYLAWSILFQSPLVVRHLCYNKIIKSTSSNLIRYTALGATEWLAERNRACSWKVMMIIAICCAVVGFFVDEYCTFRPQNLGYVQGIFAGDWPEKIDIDKMASERKWPKGVKLTVKRGGVEKGESKSLYYVFLAAVAIQEVYFRTLAAWLAIKMVFLLYITRLVTKMAAEGTVESGLRFQTDFLDVEDSCGLKPLNKVYGAIMYFTSILTIYFVLRVATHGAQEPWGLNLLYSLLLLVLPILAVFFTYLLTPESIEKARDQALSLANTKEERALIDKQAANPLNSSNYWLLRIFCYCAVFLIPLGATFLFNKFPDLSVLIKDLQQTLSP